MEADELRAKFEEWMRSTPGGARMLDEGFLETASGRFWLEIFTAGANAEAKSREASRDRE